MDKNEEALLMAFCALILIDEEEAADTLLGMVAQKDSK